MIAVVAAHVVAGDRSTVTGAFNKHLRGTRSSRQLLCVFACKTIARRYASSVFNVFPRTIRNGGLSAAYIFAKIKFHDFSRSKKKFQDFVDLES